MPKISACIISLNEEKKIEECLKSLDGIADEIIVVDSLSTDKTVQIAEKYTDKVIQQAFLGYVDQKNLAVSKAQYDWILCLDCDERISPQLKQSILEIKQDLERFDAYKMARKTFYVYRWINHCWYPDRKIRLFNKHKARWSGGNIHEKVIAGSNLVHTLDGDILHYSFDSIFDHVHTLNRYTEVAAKDIIEKGKKVNVSTPFTHAIWAFIRLYIIKRGFLDGFAGFVASTLTFMYVFVKYSKVLFFQYSKNATAGNDGSLNKSA